MGVPGTSNVQWLYALVEIGTRVRTDYNNTIPCFTLCLYGPVSIFILIIVIVIAVLAVRFCEGTPGGWTMRSFRRVRRPDRFYFRPARWISGRPPLTRPGPETHEVGRNTRVCVRTLHCARRNNYLLEERRVLFWPRVVLAACCFVGPTGMPGNFWNSERSPLYRVPCRLLLDGLYEFNRTDIPMVLSRRILSIGEHYR